MNIDLNIKMSKDFLEKYRSSEIIRIEKLKNLNDAFDSIEEGLFESEEKVILEKFLKKNNSGFDVGDKVYCNRYKCMGSIIRFKAIVNQWSDDYYYNSRVPTPTFHIIAVVQPEPTVKLKKSRPLLEIDRLCFEDKTFVLPSSETNYCEDWSDYM